MHGADWVMVKVAVPTETVAVRDVVPGFAAAVYCTVPLPDPAPVTVIQSGLFVVAVQVQAVATLNEPEAPEKLTVAFDGERL